jgi:hypothetical protein
MDRSKGITSNIDLEELANLLNLKVNYIGFAENLKGTKIKNGSYIINLGDDMIKGTHWTILHIKDKDAYYFDSFGVVPEDHLIKWLGRDVQYNKKQLQSINSQFCGQWSILAMYYLQKKNGSLKERVDKLTSKFINIRSL